MGDKNPEHQIIIQAPEGVHITPEQIQEIIRLQQMQIQLESGQETGQAQPEAQMQNLRLIQQNQSSPKAQGVELHSGSPQLQKVYPIQKVAEHQVQQAKNQPQVQRHQNVQVVPQVQQMQQQTQQTHKPRVQVIPKQTIQVNNLQKKVQDNRILGPIPGSGPQKQVQVNRPQQVQANMPQQQVQVNRPLQVQANILRQQAQVNRPQQVQANRPQQQVQVNRPQLVQANRLQQQVQVNRPQQVQANRPQQQVQQVSKPQNPPIKLSGITGLLAAVKRNETALICRSVRYYGIPRSGTKTTDYLCLQKALEKNNTEVAKALIEKGCRINSQPGDTDLTPLALAVANKDVEVVQLLLQRNVNLDVGKLQSYNSLQRNLHLLQFAAQQNSFNVMQVLIRHPRININQVDSSGETVIQQLMSNGYRYDRVNDTDRCKLISLLLAQGANINFQNTDGSTALHCVAKLKSNDIFNCVIRYFTNVNICDKAGNTALHLLLSSQKMEDLGGAVQALLAKGAKVDLPNKSSTTPLHILAKNKNFEILRMFLPFAQNINTCDTDGDTILHILLRDSIHSINDAVFLEIVMNLLEKKVQIEIQNKRKQTPLHLAAQSGQKKILQQLLSYAVKMNISDINGDTYLHHILNAIFRKNDVVDEDDLNIIQTLVTKGCRADAKNSNGITPVHMSLQLKSNTISNFLIQNVQDVNVCDDKGRSFLYYLTSKDCGNEVEERDRVITARLLLDRGAIVDLKDKNHFCTPLHNAVASRQKEMIKVLLAHNANVNLCTSEGKTALHLLLTSSSSTNDSEIVKMLISSGTKLDVIYEHGETFLHTAARNKKLNKLMILLDHISEVNFQNSTGDTVLHYLLKFNSCNEDKCVKIVSILLSKGAKVNLSNQAGETPLHVAVTCLLPKVVKILIEHNADVTLCNSKGNNVLHLVCMIGVTNENATTVLEMLELIFSRGINVTVKNKNGESPLVYALKTGNATVIGPLLKHGAGLEDNALHIATESKNSGIIKILLDCRGNVNFKDANGKTALHIAVDKNQEENLKILLRYGGDANARDTTGKTPLHWACWFNRQELIRELLDYGGDVNVIDSYGTTPLMLSQNHNQLAWNMMQYRIDRLRLAGVPICKLNDSCIANCKKPLDSGDYAEQCLQEIEKLKVKKICDRPMLYEILVLNKNRFIEYGYNNVLLAYMDSKSFKTEFPLYSDLIKAAYCRMRVRNDLLESSKQALFRASKIGLTNEDMEHILEYMENDDMRNLIDAAYLRTSKRKIDKVDVDDEEEDRSVKRIRLDKSSEDGMVSEDSDLVFVAAY